MVGDDVARVRSFNGTVTQRLGALSDRFLGRERPLGQARLLWEIGVEGSEVRELRARLALDSGYTSRLLRALENQGLAAVTPDPSDGRVRRATLTAAGMRERRELDRLADEFAASLLRPLTESRQRRLVAAMGEVERLLAASEVTIEVADPAGADARWCVGQYFAVLDERFEGGFDPARSISAEPDELTPPAGVFLVARLRGEPVGCGALKIHRRSPGEIKRMWVAPHLRGLGLGRRILVELERRAAEAEVRVLRLETNRALTEAIALYRSHGYREVEAFNEEPYAHDWFERRL